jgi:septum formation protein
MLLSFLPELSKRRILLGSSSPRRKEILEQQLGLTIHQVVPSTFPETLNKKLFSPLDYVQSTCLGKTYELLGRVPAVLNEDSDVLICADTVVEIDGEILEKPGSPEAAKAMLRSLSGRTHLVHTCVSLSTISEQRNFLSTTAVTFEELIDAAIDSFVSSGEPFDKAGGYGIQAGGSTFVSKLEGCYFNVVGLPASKTAKEIIALISD